MRNSRGLTINERIAESIEVVKQIEGTPQERKALALRAMGVADFAVEFGLISVMEWEAYIHDIFTML